MSPWFLKVIINVAYTDEFLNGADDFVVQYFCWPIVITQYAYWWFAMHFGLLQSEK